MIYRFEIDKYMHGFSVSSNSLMDGNLIYEFGLTLTQYESKYNFTLKMKIKAVKNSFYTFNYKTKKYGFHISLLDEFLKYLRRCNVYPEEIRLNLKKIPEYKPAYINLSTIAVPKDYQDPIVGFITEDEVDTLVLPLQTGKGKSLILDCPIKVPNGWTSMRDINIGDEITAKDGSTTKVTAIFPQGSLDMYKVTFVDGRSTICCKDHLWKIYTLHDNVGLTATTSQIMARLIYGLGSSYIDLVSHSDDELYKMPLDSYVLGCMLSDSWYHGGYVHLDIYEEYRDVLNELTDGYRVIPDIYLNGSKEQKLQLLEGFFDNALRVVVNTGVVIYTTHEHSVPLLQSIQCIIRSLGGIVSINNGMFQHNPYITILIQSDGCISNTVVNAKNKGKVKYMYPCDFYTARTDKLEIMSIEPCGKYDAQCISVEHEDKLFVLNDFIVTHNTFCTLYSISKLGIRTAIVMGAMHVETWLKDASWMYETGIKGISVIKGKEQLQHVIKCGKDGTLDSQIIIISATTLRNYITDCEDIKLENDYGCDPIELYEILGVGFVVVDEAHENLHFNVKHVISTNVSRRLFLSATIKSHDPFVNKMYEHIFPINTRYTNLAWDKYIEFTSIGYVLLEKDKAKYLGGDGRYSHVAYEQWIFKSPVRLRNYMKMIRSIILRIFIDSHQEGQKILVFMATVEMCRLTSLYLRNFTMELQVHDYTASHHISVLTKNDIIITTPKSCGTGKDVKGLVTALNTVAISSMEKNIQIVGRLRQVKELYPNVTPAYYQLVCMDIPQHVNYHNERTKFMGAYVAKMSTRLSEFKI